jgi:Arc/MetJ family transcription regulator
MRTTLDLPEDLLLEAMKTTRVPTKTKVIIIALEQLIKKSKISEIKKYKGQIDLGMNIDDLRGRKCRS